MGKRAALGFPIQLMARMLNVGSGLGGGIASTVGKVALAAGVVGTVAAQVASVVPSLNNTLAKDSNQDANDLGQSLNPLEALLTFFDFNANVLDFEEKRRLAIVDVPGREGDFIQNLGSKSVTYRLTGRFFAVDPKKTPSSPFADIFKTAFDNNVAVGSTQLLRLLERSGVPAPFMCEYDMAEVIIANCRFIEEGGSPERINYVIDLIEYRRLPQLAKMLGLAALGLM